MDVFMKYKNVTLSSKAIKIKIAPSNRLASLITYRVSMCRRHSSFYCVLRARQPMMTALLAPLFLFIGVIAVPIGACAGWCHTRYRTARGRTINAPQS